MITFHVQLLTDCSEEGMEETCTSILPPKLETESLSPGASVSRTGNMNWGS